MRQITLVQETLHIREQAFSELQAQYEELQDRLEEYQEKVMDLEDEVVAASKIKAVHNQLHFKAATLELSELKKELQAKWLRPKQLQIRIEILFLLDILVFILRTQEEKHRLEVSQLKLELAEAQAELQQGKMSKKKDLKVETKSSPVTPIQLSDCPVPAFLLEELFNSQPTVSKEKLHSLHISLHQLSCLQRNIASLSVGPAFPSLADAPKFLSCIWGNCHQKVYKDLGSHTSRGKTCCENLRFIPETDIRQESPQPNETSETMEKSTIPGDWTFRACWIVLQKKKRKKKKTSLSVTFLLRSHCF
ncbi:uncharacterized protein [Notamacropus eugenii]|uniref:uncharacterized protein n=1 Tax=Notamacropus eugenii TaxID=9315 RepID=UPI003B66D7CC